MFKLLKYLKNSKPTVALILLLLVVQAVCDLALPQYTSSIVDVGIQQGGIETAAPTQIRAQTMQSLQLFMTDDELRLVEDTYTQGDGLYTRNTNDAEAVAAVADAFTLPMVALSAAGEALADTPALAGGLDAIPREQVLAMREAITGEIGVENASLLEQRAIAFVKAEYEAQGVDTAALQTRYLLVTGAKMLGITLVMVGTAVLVGLLSARTAARIGRDLRSGIYEKVLSFSIGDMDKFSTASLITRSTNDITQVQTVTVMLLRMVIYSPILGIGGVIKVANTNTGMSWIIFVAVIIIMSIVAILMVIAMPKFQKMQTLVDRINLVSREILTGLPVIRAFSRERYEEDRFEQANTDLMGTQLFTNRVMTFMMPLMMMLMNCVTLAIVWFGAQGIDMGNLQVGDMMAFITYTMQIVMSFLMLTIISVMLPRASVAAGRIDEVLNTPSSITDGESNVAQDKTDWQGVVAFDNVSFRYADAEENILSGISFTAQPGETTAIIGGTGSGKSTLLNLIPRFFDVTQGHITLDGIDIRDMSQHTLRAQIGYVPQKGVLFSGDIASNIKYGDEDLPDAQMVDAATIAQAADFIEEKAEQYHAPIAQGGTNVSGGQKQRLSIARAIAIQPKVLLFDDSFSALDYRTDVTLRRALNEHVKDATVIIVAQRISTILHADQILVLSEGRIVGQGTHEALMQSCEEYQDIARSQLSEAELKGGTQA